MTIQAFENAIMVHAAIAGSSNSLLHLPAIAHELGIQLSPDLFDKIHRKIPYLLNIRPSGFWPGEYFWYAGGVPAIMEEIKEFLHLDVMTVTGKTLEENLKDLQLNGFYKNCHKYLSCPRSKGWRYYQTSSYTDQGTRSHRYIERKFSARRGSRKTFGDFTPLDASHPESEGIRL